MKRGLHYKILFVFCFVFFGACVFFAGADDAHAMRLFFDPAEETVGRGDQFIVRVRIDTEGACINTIDATIRYAHEKLRAVDVSRGQSFLTLWVRDPRIDAERGTITFAGGIPGGYCGRIPGDTGGSDVVASIIFRIPGFTVSDTPSEGEAVVSFTSDTQVLLHDGLGTPGDVRFDGALFHIESRAGTRGDEWQAVVREDTTPPESFDISIHRDPLVFEGKYYIMFSTTDKQSGISHYEVRERDGRGFVPGTNRQAEWIVATAPYVLQDQDLRGIIEVKAVYKAGNEATISVRGADLEQSLLEELEKVRRDRVRAGLLVLSIIVIFVLYIAIRIGMHYRRR